MNLDNIEVLTGVLCTRHQIEKDAKGRCGKCSTEATDRLRQKNKMTLVQEAGGKCVKCTYDRCMRALTFHHRDPATKEFDISGKARTYSLARLRIEAAKCDLVCMNCHMELTEQEQRCGNEHGCADKSHKLGVAGSSPAPAMMQVS